MLKPSSRRTTERMPAHKFQSIWQMLRGRNDFTFCATDVRDDRKYHEGHGWVVVEDGARDVTVQYTCRGNGYGRTHIRKETGTLVQIDSQGISGGKPFQFTAEARQTGRCG